MIIKNASVYTENGVFEERDIYIEGDKFVADESLVTDATVVDGTGCYAIPGLTDIHFHGCVGADFCDGNVESIEKMAEYEASVGVTNICPASMTLAKETLLKVAKAAKEYHDGPKKPKLARLYGINMEGPFVSLAKLGAQNKNYLHNPDMDMFREINEASGGLIKMCDVAPELPGAIEFIKECSKETMVSLAHSAATCAVAKEAFEAGATHVTHLYNGMNGYHHREPGIIGAACDTEKVHVELIGDGVHIAPEAVRTTLKMFGEDRVIIISDSMMATGLTDGDYELGEQPVKVKGNLATLADGTIAGSATNLMDCVRVLVKDMNIPLETAVKCAAVNPAKEIGIFDRVGSIEPQKLANVVLLRKEDLSLKQVIVEGE